MGRFALAVALLFPLLPPTPARSVYRAPTPIQMCHTFARSFNALTAKKHSPLVVVGAIPRRYTKTLSWCAILVIDSVSGFSGCYVVLVDSIGKVWNGFHNLKVSCEHPWRNLTPIA